MRIRPSLAFLSGAVLVAAGGYLVAARTAPTVVSALEQRADQTLAELDAGRIETRFADNMGSPSRHPLLSGGESYDEAKRAEIARAIATVPGVGGIAWADGTARAERGERIFEPLHCQEDVEGLLRTRSIRFEEASSALLPASRLLLDEVAEALRPCLGSIIAITGHTDNSGTEPGNISLSIERARAVREALIRRGIPRDGLRARGVGSSEPVEGLAPSDPANRRIEFSVIRTEPLVPTPIDTPGPR